MVGLDPSRSLMHFLQIPGRWKSKSKMSMKMCAMISPKRCVKNAFEEFEDCVDLVLLNLESGRGDPSVQRDGLLWRPAVPAP